MNTYEKIKLVHMTIGAVALIAFWVAAIARKGGPVHRAAGKVYLLTLICVMVSTLPFVAVSASEGRVSQVMLLSYLLLITLTAAWLTWRSIRDRRDSLTSTRHYQGQERRVARESPVIHDSVRLPR